MFLSFLNLKGLMEESGEVQNVKETFSSKEPPVVEGRLMAVDTDLGKSVRLLPPGAVFRGEVRDVTGTRVTIQSGNETISARFDRRIPISIGENLRFAVKENTEDKFIISPVLDSSMSAEDQMLYKALDSAGLAATDKNIDIVAALLKNQMPVSAAEVKHLLSQGLKYPQAEVADLIFLNKMKLPVTEESLLQLSQLRKQVPVLKEGISDIAENLPETILQLIKNEKLPEARQLLAFIFPEKAEETEHLQKDGEKNQAELENRKGREGIKSLLHALSQGDVSKVRSFLSEKGGLLSGQFQKEMGLEPEEFTKAGIQEAIQKVTRQMFGILELSQGNPELSDLSESAVSVLSEAAFLSDIRGGGQEGEKRGDKASKKLWKIPLKMGGKFAQGDLYVYSRKRGRNGAAAGEEVSLLLHLDLNALKNLNIMVKLKRKDLSVQIGTETDEIRNHIRKGLPQLVEALQKKGFFVNAMAVREEDAKEKVSDFLDAAEEMPKVKRYAFDMRV